MNKWTIETCDFEGAKIIEQVDEDKTEQVATVAMATPEAMALIVAAPEMLEALKFMELGQTTGNWEKPYGEVLELCKAAIAKAEDVAGWEAAEQFDKA